MKKKTKEELVEAIKREDLLKNIRDLQARLNRLEDKRNSKISKGLLGKYFKVTDRFSSGKTWDIYYAVIKASGPWVTTAYFYKDANGVFHTGSELRRNNFQGCTEISPDRFQWAYEKFEAKRTKFMKPVIGGR